MSEDTETATQGTEQSDQSTSEGLSGGSMSNIMESFLSSDPPADRGQQQEHSESTRQQQDQSPPSDRQHQTSTRQQASSPSSRTQQGNGSQRNESTNGREDRRAKLEGLPPEWQRRFMNMNNDAYEAARALYDQSVKWDGEKKTHEEALRAAANQRFYDVEGAWNLDPGIQQLAAQHSNLGNEVAFWQQQLEAAEGGGKVQLLELDEKGNVTASAPQDATPGLKAKIMGGLTRATQLQSDTLRELEGSRGKFTSEYKGFHEELDKVRHEIFGKHEAKLGKLRDVELQKFPRAYHNHPLARGLAEAFVVINLLNNALKKEQAAAAGKKLNSSARQTAITDAVESAGRGRGDADISAFKKLMPNGKLLV